MLRRQLFVVAAAALGVACEALPAIEEDDVETLILQCSGVENKPKRGWRFRRYCKREVRAVAVPILHKKIEAAYRAGEPREIEHRVLCDYAVTGIALGFAVEEM